LVLQRLKKEGLKLRLKKCFFGLQEMEYLGYIVSTGKISVSIKKVEAFAAGQCLRRRRKFAISRNSATSTQDLFVISRPYGSIDGLIAEVPSAEGYACAFLFGSL
jgi:hypothetical protein